MLDSGFGNWGLEAFEKKIHEYMVWKDNTFVYVCFRVMFSNSTSP